MDPQATPPRTTTATPAVQATSFDPNRAAGAAVQPLRTNRAG